MRQTYLMSDLLQRLEMGGVDLVTREYGQQAYPLLAQALRQTPADSYLVFDFAGVRTVDTAFTRETFVRLLGEVIDGQFGGARFLLANLSANALETFEILMERRKNLGFFLVLQPTGLYIAGHMEPNLREVYALLKECKEVSVRDLAEKLHLEINTASTRLKKLYDTNATTRREEIIERGRQHIYRLLGV